MRRRHAPRAMLYIHCLSRLVMKVGLNLKDEFGLTSTYKVSCLLAVDSLLWVVNLFREITAVYSEKLMEQINKMCDQ